MQRKKINTAVIGAGNMGKFHARNYFEIPKSNLVAISDTDKKLKKIARNYNCKFYTSYQEMLSKENIDAVSIAVPTKYHTKIALDAIKRKINLIIEKPIADNLNGAKKIIKEAKKNKVVITVGHIERFNPVVQKLKHLIKNENLGKITSIIIRRVGLYPPKQPTANVILDLAIHDIDIINFLTDDLPKKVISNSQKIFGDYEDSAEIFLKYKKFTAFIQVNWITPVKTRKIIITGTKGYVEADYITQNLTLYKNNNRDFKKLALFSTFEKFTALTKSYKKNIIPIKKKEPLKEELINFLETIDKKNELLVPVSEAYSALEIAIKAYKNKFI